MTVTVMMDGQLVAPEQARVSVFDRGFLFGDSVFETIRTYGGIPFALDEHLARLERSAELVYIPMPTSVEQLAAEVRQALAASNNPESYVRVMLTRGEGDFGLDPALADRPLRVLIVRPLVPLAAESYQRGVSAVTFKTMRPSDATAAEGAKIGNYLVAVLGTRAAKQAGAHEALIVDVAGRVVEGATSNVFHVVKGELFTPPASAGILLGITRDRAIAAAEGLGLKVRQQLATVEELIDADEVFISSSIRELVPVVRIDGRAVGDARPGVLTRQIHAAFRRRIAAELGLPRLP